MFNTIKSITISNFKCFKNETINFSDLTLISGLNNTGKSTIYQILLLLEPAFYSEITPINTFLNLNTKMFEFGNPEEILNNPRKNEFSIKFNFENGEEAIFKYKLSKDKKGFSLNFLELSDNDENGTYFLFKKISDKKNYIKAKKSISLDIDIMGIFLLLVNAEENKHIKNNDSTNKHSIYKLADRYFSETVMLKNVEKIYIDPFVRFFDTDIKNLKNCLKKKYQKYYIPSQLKEELNKAKILECSFQVASLKIIKDLKYFFKCLGIIKPFRGEPKRIYTETEYKNPLLFTTMINDSITIPYKFDTKTKEIMKTTFKKALKYWISQIIPNISSFKINILVNNLVSETLIKDGKKNISINNVGFGISQILPLIVNILINKICIIDEPEVHLHPGLQSKLADFFIEMIKLGKKIIIETHSDHIINGILYRKLIDETLNDRIKMLWVNKNYDTGNSNIEEIKYDKYGYILNQPMGFLDEGKKIVSKINRKRIEKFNA